MDKPHEPSGDQVEWRRSGGGSVHVADQLGQAILPFYVGLRLEEKIAVEMLCNV